MNLRLPLCALCLPFLSFAAPDAQAAVKSFALVVGVNSSVDEGVASLHYADDDAAKFARLFDRLTDQTILLTVFDEDSRLLYQDLAGRARAPQRAQLERAINELREAAVKEHAAGNQVVVYFAYVGHGARTKEGEGYVNLADQRLTRTDLHRLLIDPPAKAAAAFDTLHVIVDACSAYFVVHERGAGVSKADGDFSGRMGELFGSTASPEKSPQVGYLLATTGDAKVHEWSAYRGGVFSHLVRSALSGAADVDLDGRVSYAEMGAFISAASGTIQDPRARVDVTVTPPPGSLDAPLSDRNRFKPRQLVLLDPKLDGHYEIETEGGERLLDLNKPKGLPSVVALWGAGKYYLSGKEGETLLDFSKKSAVASSSQSFSAPRKSERGAVDEEYRRSLFSRPYDLSFYRAYCSLTRLPMRDTAARTSFPEELLKEATSAAITPAEAEPVARAATGATPPAGRKITVAVLYFDYDGKNEDMAVLKKGLAQMLITDLAGNGEFTVVERARLQDVMDELHLNQTAKFDQTTANKVGKLLGARYLVMGRYFELLGTLRVDARTVETETGKHLHDAGAHGKPEEFLEIEQKIAKSLGDALAKVVPAAGSGEVTPPTTAPKSPKKLQTKTAMAYSKALDAIDRKDKVAAKKELEAVVREQPDFALASNELAGLVR